MTGMTVSEAVARRRSVRAYLDKPVPRELIEQVLEKARMAPSGCNFQPWEAAVLTGAPLKALQAEMLADPAQQDPIEYAVNPPDTPPEYFERLFEIGAALYASQGISRDDKQARADEILRNFVSFDAPAVLFCAIPRVMGPPQWSDVGMWLQTVMLLLCEAGLDSCAQEYMSFHGRRIKRHIGFSDETHLLFCGLAIGYRDPDAPQNNFTRTRVPLERSVKFLGF